MILYRGEIFDDKELPRLRADLPRRCLEAIASQRITAGQVMAACGELAARVRRGDYDEIIQPFLSNFSIDPARFAQALALFQPENLAYKVQLELGGTPPLQPPGCPPIRRERFPLGVLFHIAAGNVDGLPAYSVVEGLLAGNVNILKLPSLDRGASLLLLRELVALEPALRDFVYVFDVPSTDTETLMGFARLADGIVVWGGDEAVKAARTLAPPEAEVIAWGHKLSFAYVSGDPTDEGLRALARHVCQTRQLLCSSCQGIFVDSGDMRQVAALGERFFAILQEEDRQHPPADISLRAKAALHQWNEALEAHATGRKILRGGRVGVAIAPDSRLELSPLAGNCWVKPLPRARLVTALKPEKGRLQTAGLLCPAPDRPALSQLLARAGVVRVTPPAEMSRTLPGEAHDGSYPLQRYTRLVELS